LAGDSRGAWSMSGGTPRSISMRLSAIARKRGVPFQNVLTEFLIERLVVRLLSINSFKSAVVFKGGFVGMRAYDSPRYTVDLDALVQGVNLSRSHQIIINGVEMFSGDGVWFHFEKMLDLKTQGEYPGIRLSFRAGLGEKKKEDIIRAQIINFDMGVGDRVTPVSVQTECLLTKAEISWRVYPREVIVAEKLHSFFSRPLGNSRSKDLYDLFFHLPLCNAKKLRSAVNETFAGCKTIVPDDIPRTFSELRVTTLQQGWASATSGLREIGSFDETFKEVVRLLASRFPVSKS
jgi:predicted nucleotidyltransferase component of viral defense system